jgi:hypothetical protein
VDTYTGFQLTVSIELLDIQISETLENSKIRGFRWYRIGRWTQCKHNRIKQSNLLSIS